MWVIYEFNRNKYESNTVNNDKQSAKRWYDNTPFNLTNDESWKFQLSN